MGKLTIARRRARNAFLFVEKNVINRLVRFQLEVGLAPDALALLETTGRSSGATRRTPVGNGLIGDTFWLVAERGEEADYVRNIRTHPRVRVKVGRRWRPGTATVLPDDDAQARLREIVDHHGRLRAADAAILRGSVTALGTTPVTVRIDLDGRAA